VSVKQGGEGGDASSPLVLLALACFPSHDWPALGCPSYQVSVREITVFQMRGVCRPGGMTPPCPTPAAILNVPRTMDNVEHYYSVMTQSFSQKFKEL
jgi:hypothetical protein